MKWAMVSVALLVMASCQHTEENLDPTLKGFFPEDTGEVRKPNQFADMMAASGARSDATLSQYHFDGPRLNSLGQEKLSYMLRDDRAPEPMSVYLNFGEKDEMSKDRQDAVVEFLKDKGLEPRQIRVVYGYNSASWSPAADPLSKKNKASTGTEDGKGDTKDDSGFNTKPSGSGSGSSGSGGGGGASAGAGGGLFGN
jgi:hypothetical protein